MTVADEITQRLHAQMQIDTLHLDNESHLHAGPATESHFKLTLVSADFVGLSKVKRHQQVYALLADLLQNPVHALALHLYTPDEWDESQGSVPQSPQCRGAHHK